MVIEIAIGCAKCKVIVIVINYFPLVIATTLLPISLSWGVSLLTGIANFSSLIGIHVQPGEKDRAFSRSLR